MLKTHRWERGGSQRPGPSPSSGPERSQPSASLTINYRTWFSCCELNASCSACCFDWKTSSAFPELCFLFTEKKNNSEVPKFGSKVETFRLRLNHVLFQALDQKNKGPNETFGFFKNTNKSLKKCIWNNLGSNTGTYSTR